MEDNYNYIAINSNNLPEIGDIIAKAEYKHLTDIDGTKPPLFEVLGYGQIDKTTDSYEYVVKSLTKGVSMSQAINTIKVTSFRNWWCIVKDMSIENKRNIKIESLL